nr:hypothetical protein GCM10020092_092680 [Actinoplanes digitatis]
MRQGQHELGVEGGHQPALRDAGDHDERGDGGGVRREDGHGQRRRRQQGERLDQPVAPRLADQPTDPEAADDEADRAGGHDQALVEAAGGGILVEQHGPSGGQALGQDREGGQGEDDERDRAQQGRTEDQSEALAGLPQQVPALGAAVCRRPRPDAHRDQAGGDDEGDRVERDAQPGAYPDGERGA